jgi:hypothetical protein
MYQVRYSEVERRHGLNSTHGSFSSFVLCFFLTLECFPSLGDDLEWLALTGRVYTRILGDGFDSVYVSPVSSVW